MLPNLSCSFNKDLQDNPSDRSVNWLLPPMLRFVFTFSRMYFVFFILFGFHIPLRQITHYDQFSSFLSLKQPATSHICFLTFQWCFHRGVHPNGKCKILSPRPPVSCTARVTRRRMNWRSFPLRARLQELWLIQSHPPWPIGALKIQNRLSPFWTRGAVVVKMVKLDVPQHLQPTPVRPQHHLKGFPQRGTWHLRAKWVWKSLRPI